MVEPLRLASERVVDPEVAMTSTEVPGPLEGASEPIEPLHQGVDNSGRSVLGRVDSIVGAFDDADGSLTLHELTTRTGLPKSTVHRMVEQLCRIGWLERDVFGYRIGMRLFEIGGLASRHSRLSDLAYPHLHALSVTTGLAVQLAILDGPDVVYLERIPMSGFRLPTRQGGRQPAYCTGLGKAMLAYDDEAAEEVFEQDLPRRTARTLTSSRELAIELERIAATGLAFDHQESYEGLACVAAPLRGAGRAIGAISVTGPVARIDLHAVAPHLKTTAQAIWTDRFQRP